MIVVLTLLLGLVGIALAFVMCAFLIVIVDEYGDGFLDWVSLVVRGWSSKWRNKGDKI
jgi:hypothetical protein